MQKRLGKLEIRSIELRKGMMDDKDIGILFIVKLF